VWNGPRREAPPLPLWPLKYKNRIDEGSGRGCDHREDG